MNTTDQPRAVACIRFVRLLVTIFLPWIALRKARAQLHLAALCETIAAVRAKEMTPDAAEGSRAIRLPTKLTYDHRDNRLHNH